MKSKLYTWKKCRTAVSFTALDFCSFLAGKIETELSLLAEKLKSLSITVKDEKFKVIQSSFFKTIVFLKGLGHEIEFKFLTKMDSSRSN
jgi:hypothetical protein